MWTRTHTKVYSGVKKQDVWRLWTKVNQWAIWHADLDYCKMEGPFAVGNHFILKPKGVSPFKIELTEIQEGKQFTDCTKFFGAKMYDTHIVEEVGDGVRITNILEVTGPLQFLWVNLVAKNVAKSVPEEVDAFIKYLKSEQRND